ncbi:TPA: hypothetical protein ACG0QE_004622 [Pseudomonas aeruginosa]|uniref:hypothetical protein n=2 Tax=Pseudomonas TaxID=286 RepID=UPI0011C04F26|nr:hypothetical protein [Pseudomonas aeruginosa]
MAKDGTVCHFDMRVIMIARLETEAGSIVFSLKSKDMGSDFFGFSVHVYLREDFPKFLSGDFFCELNSADIKRLKEYFSSHLAGLKLQHKGDRFIFLL